MAEVTYADPTTTRTPLHFDVLPPIQQAAPITITAPTRQPFDVQQDAPGQLARPIDYHAQPQNIPEIQQKIKNNDSIIPSAQSRSMSRFQDPTLPSGVTPADVESASAVGKFLLGAGDQLSGQNTLQNNDYQVRKDQQRYVFTPLENLSYEFGRRTADGAQITLNDLWDKRPRFEIPTIKIPKFQLPGLPDFTPKNPNPNPGDKPSPGQKDKPIPGQPKPTVEEPKPQPEQKKFPEKDFPRPTELKPRPIPKNFKKQLKKLDLSPCGSISFSIAYTTKIMGEYFVPNSQGTGGYFEQITVPSSLDEMYGLFSEWYARTYNDNNLPSVVDWVGAGGGTGEVRDVDLGGGNTYKAYIGIGNGCYSNGSPYGSGYPKYYASQANIHITGSTNKSSVNYLVDSLSFDGKTPTIYDLHVSDPGADGCPLKPRPDPPDPPPPDPPEDCDCMSQCCPEIDYRKIQAIIAEEVKKLDVTAAIPLSFQIRHEGATPQMIIQCAERKSAASANKAAKYDSAKYPITVPHWKGGKSDKPALPPYKKGNWEGILVLADNSKVTINAQNESECIKILNAIKPWIDKKMLEGSYFKGGKITTSEPIKEIQVYPKYGRYFGKGQKNNKPDWRVDFP